MKKHIKSIIVIVLTFITLVVMSRYRASTVVKSAPADVERHSTETQYDTGYIFDDYNKNINIKINNK